DDLDRAREQIDAVGIFPRRIGIRKMPSDIALRAATEDGVGDGVAQHVGVRVADEAHLVRNPDAANHQRTARLEPMEVVPDADSHGRLTPTSARAASRSSSVVIFMFQRSPSTRRTR